MEHKYHQVVDWKYLDTSQYVFCMGKHAHD